MPIDAPTYASFIRIAETQDLFAAIDHLQSTGTPSQVALLYDQLHLDAYWKHKNLPMVVTLTTAGIHFCLTHAHLATDPALAYSLKSTAKGLAYNLASFTWPGWDEPCISSTLSNIALGLQAARFNLRFALELQKPPNRIRSAHWLLGAQLLAAPHPDHLNQALAQFQLSLPPDPADSDYPLFRGYILLAEMLLGRPAAEGQWMTHLGMLQCNAEEGSQFAYAQLTTARRIFQPAP